jgi:hypothetical protein
MQSRPETNSREVPFEVIFFEPVHKGQLLARIKLLMPSGLILTCSVMKRKDGEGFFVTPVAERRPGGSWNQIVDFASAKLREAWQARALAALRPHWSQLTQPQQAEENHYAADF